MALARFSSAERETVTLMARVGFASRGLIYLMIGGFAISAAVSGERPRGLGGVLQWLARAPLGGAVLGAIAVGLACLAGWLAIRGFARASRTAGGKSWLLGLAMVADGVLYGGFVAIVLGVALHGRSGGDSELQLWVGWLFGHPSGRVLVGLAGIAILCGGIGLAVWAWTRDVERPLAMSPRGKHLTEPISRYGVAGRGGALALVGIYLGVAAIDADPSKAHGLGGVLHDVWQTPYGWIVLLLFALAFVAAGFFDFLEALFRREGAEIG